MTTTTGQNHGAVFVSNAVDAWNNENVVEVNSVELRIPPLVWFRGARSILIHESADFRFLSQLFCVQTLPLPSTIFDRIAKRPSVRRLHSLAVIQILVLVVMTLGARFQGGIQRSKELAAVFGMAIRTTNAGFAVGRDDAGNKVFCLMTSGTLIMHFLAVSRAHPEYMARRAGISIRHLGDRRRETKAGTRMWR